MALEKEDYMIDDINDLPAGVRAELIDDVTKYLFAESVPSGIYPDLMISMDSVLT